MDLALPVLDYGNNSRPTPSEQTIVGIEGDSPTILVIDDSQEDVALLKDFLNSIGFQTHRAADGLTGLSFVQQQHPDLIITDLMIPNVNGVEFLQQLRQMQNTKATPVIVNSANVFDINRQQSLAAGANVFLPKPIDFKALTEALQTLLKLQWIYAKTAEVVATSKAIQAEFPDVQADVTMQLSPILLEELYHLAMMGNLQGIEGKLKEITVTDIESQKVIDQLQQLVANFQVKQIKALLHTCISSQRAV